MMMTETDICREYRQAANQRAQIGILADLNVTTKREIMAILERNGVVFPPMRGVNRSWDKARARTLYDQGKTDREIAELVGVIPNTINVWRRGLRLPSNRCRRTKEDCHGEAGIG